MIITSSELQEKVLETVKEKTPFTVEFIELGENNPKVRFYSEEKTPDILNEIFLNGNELSRGYLTVKINSYNNKEKFHYFLCKILKRDIEYFEFRHLSPTEYVLEVQ